MSETRPSPDSTGGHDLNDTALERDTARPLFGASEAIARCPDCRREVLWSKREHLTHADGCEVGE